MKNKGRLCGKGIRYEDANDQYLADQKAFADLMKNFDKDHSEKAKQDAIRDGKDKDFDK